MRRTPALAAVVLAALTAPSAFAAAEAPSIRTIAGTGAAIFGGDGGRALAAQLNAPGGVAVAPGGALLIADSGNHRVRRVAADGTITTIAGTGAGGFAGDGGPAVAAQLLFPSSVAAAADGTVYIADTGNHRVRRIALDGTITTVVGSGSTESGLDGQPGPATPLNEPAGVAVDAAGRLVVADSAHDLVRRLDPDGTVHVVAGVIDASGYNGDGQPATLATLDSPAAVAFDAAGTLYVADADNHRVRRVGTDGVISTVAGIGAVYDSTGDGGPATAAAINNPAGVAVDAQGAVYVSEASGQRVRRIAPDGTISTVAGTGETGYSGEFGPATEANLSAPAGLAIDERGRLVIADRQNQRIRRVADLRPELGTVARAAATARAGGPARATLPATARRLCGVFRFGRLPADGLPVTVRFRKPGGASVVVSRARATQVVACLQVGAATRLRQGDWRVVLRVAGRELRTVRLRVEAP